MPYETLWGPVPRDRQEMLDFLRNHERYYDPNSYSMNIKISHLPLTREQRDACYDLRDVDDCYDLSGFTERLQEFDRSWSHAWQIGTAGRGGGYLVLYQGGQRPSAYKQCCGHCGQKNYSAEAKVCGRCHSSKMHPFEGIEVYTYSGRGMDAGEDFETWDDEHLDERYELIKDFDEACADAVANFVDYAMAHKVIEKTIMVPQKVKIAVSRDA